MEQVYPEKKYVVVGNPNATNSEVQESEITPGEASSTPVVREKFMMEGYRDVKKGAPTKVHNVIALAALMLLVAILFLGVIALCVAFALEIPKLKSETNAADQQSSISALTNSAAEQQSSVSTLMNRLDNLNSSMEQLSQQLLQAIDSQTQQVASSLIQQINSSLEFLSQQLLQDISEIDNKTQQINSSLELFSQQLLQDISAIDIRVEQINSSQQMFSQQLQQDISAIDGRIEQVNSSQQIFSQQLLQDISAIDGRVEQVNSSQQIFSQQLFQDISAIDGRIEQVNSSQQMLSQLLFQDISAIDCRIEQVNSSLQMLSQQQLQDISAIDDRIEQVNSSQQMLSQQISTIDGRVEQVNTSQQMLSQRLFQDISAIDSRVQQVNSSQQMLFQQLLQDISAIDSRVEQVNSSQQMFSQQLLQDISAIDGRVEQVNSSQQMLFQQLLQDISAVDNRTQDINSSLSQQLLQDFSAIESRIEQVNISLLQQVNEVQTQAQETVDNLEALGELPTFPASSCAAILSSLPSGFYYVRNSNGSAVRVYCDMTLSCSGVTGGWMRVVDVDFNDSNITCPSGLREDIDPTFGIRTCVKADDETSGCTSIEYSASDVTYSSVCGKLIAYQFGTPEAFSRFIVISSLGISSQYLDGISLTHGNPMEHIWSFALGVTESRTDRFGCPCNVGSTVSVMNTFIGTDYFCDSAASSIASGMRYPDNPLFDGVGCAATNGCCSFNNPPWFYKQLPQSTTDNLEMRFCRDERGTTENALIQSIELYVR